MQREKEFLSNTAKGQTSSECPVSVKFMRENGEESTVTVARLNEMEWLGCSLLLH